MKRPWHVAVPRSSTASIVSLLAAVCAILLVVSALTDEEGDSRTDAERGAELFSMEFTPEQGLGPVFNQTGCAACHLEPSVGGVGRNGLETVLRVGRLFDGHFDPLVGRGGPVARSHAIAELGVDCDRVPGIPAGANVTSVRNTPSLFGTGLIDEIPDEVILAGAIEGRGDRITGEPNLVRGPDDRELIGRFGWKADVATLEQFVAEALRNELGVTSLLAPGGPPPAESERCAGESADPEVDEDAITAITAFVAALPAPQPLSDEPAGAQVFDDIGCAACHTPTLEAGEEGVHLYSDLLLHDMGPALDDQVIQGSASGREWRTAPLWGLADRTRYLHDGRAKSIADAILAHGGEAQAAREHFRSLPRGQLRALLEFLRTR